MYEDENNLYHYSYRKGDEQNPNAPIDTKSYAEDPWDKNPGGSPKKKGGSGLSGKIVALALVCALVGGFIGAGVSGATTKVNKTSVQVSDREVAQVQTVKVDGKTQMSMSEVYASNVNSVVSINVSATTNYFGQTVQARARGIRELHQCIELGLLVVDLNVEGLFVLPHLLPLGLHGLVIILHFCNQLQTFSKTIPMIYDKLSNTLRVQPLRHACGVPLPGLRLPASASLALASCWPRPQQRLPVSATGGGRRCCSYRGEALAFRKALSLRQRLPSLGELSSEARLRG